MPPEADIKTWVLAALAFLITSVGSGQAVYVTMEQVKKWWPSRLGPLTSDMKFYMAGFFAFFWPVLAYTLLVWAGATVLSPYSVGFVVYIGYLTSQKIKRDEDKKIDIPLTTMEGD